MIWLLQGSYKRWDNQAKSLSGSQLGLKNNAVFPLRFAKIIWVGMVGNNFFSFFNSICYFMKTLVRMFIFSPFHEASSKLLKDLQI